jgi:hypothetical protein
VPRQRIASHERYAHDILSAVGLGDQISKRALANRLGIALGLASRLVRKGLIRVTRVRPNRLAYFLTPRGILEKTRLSRVYF